jgi:basic membrane protein A
MKKFLALALVLALCLPLASCASAGQPSQPQGSQPSGSESDATATATAANPMKIGYVVAGNLGDKSTNDNFMAGLQKYADETGATVTAVECAELADHAINAQNFAEQGYDLVVVGLYSVSDMIGELAPQFPDTMFWINGGYVDGQENVYCCNLQSADVNFLVGAFSVYFSESQSYGNKVGWLGGQRNPFLEQGQYGFSAGAAYAGGESVIAYVGNFTDSAKGKELSMQMYDSGVHMIQGWGGAAGHGAFQAADALGEGYFCSGGGNLQGQFDLAAQMLACAGVGEGEAVYDACKSFEKGELKGGVYALGVKDGVNDIVYNPGELGELIPDEVKTKMDEIRAKIASGELVAPQTEEEYDKFLAEFVK